MSLHPVMVYLAIGDEELKDMLELATCFCVMLQTISTGGCTCYFILVCLSSKIFI